MSLEAGEEEQRRELLAAMARANISVDELWLHYFSLSGSIDEFETEAWIQGLLSLPTLQRDLLAHAANELLPSFGRHPEGTA